MEVARPNVSMGFATINPSSASSAAGPGRAGTGGGAATFGLSGRGELLPVGLLLELIGMLQVMFNGKTR